MKKNTKKIPGGNYNNDFPEVINMDSLSYYDDNNLESLLEYLQSEREKVVQTGQGALAWEIEICYVQRELKIRSTRKLLHEKYMKNNPDDFYDYSYSTNVME